MPEPAHGDTETRVQSDDPALMNKSKILPFVGICVANSKIFEFAAKNGFFAWLF